MRRVTAGVLLLALFLSGCSALNYTKSLFVAGVSLDALGDQFVQVSTQVTKGCDVDKSIPDDVCVRYRAFGLRFKQIYPTLVGLWKAAENSGDAAAKRKAEDIALQLAEDLSKLAVEAINSMGVVR